MKTKVLVAVIMVVMVISGGALAGCAAAPAPGAAAEAAIQPLEVSIAAVDVFFSGTESISLFPVFSVYNPNDYPVTVKKMTSEVLVDGWWAGSRDLDLNAAVPAKGESMVVVGADVMVPGWLAGWGLTADKGLGLAECQAALVPTWKSLNGGLFSAGLKETWDAAAYKAPMFVVKGKVDLRSPGGQDLPQDYTATWELPPEFSPGQRTAQ
ncbi:MAG TPA: LEA type 2 family protein [Dehalococcoidia bacterium]|nr:LEA type 2 family protein [Dehalococcoidia bacterium]